MQMRLPQMAQFAILRGVEMYKRVNKSSARPDPPPFDVAAFLATQGNGRSISTHQKNGIIFAQDAVADAVFYIKKGKIKVTTVSKHGKEAIVAIFSADDFLGEGCIIGQPTRLATASAMTECVTMRVGKTEIIRVLRDEPTFSKMFIAHLLARNARLAGC